MDTSRPVSHLVYPSVLQTHVLNRPGSIISPSSLALLIKSAALICRGLVIADPDLNNNPSFHAIGVERGVLRDAIDAGFIRRAIRVGPAGDPIPQQEVANGLRLSSPARYAAIPNGYPASLDRLFMKSEELAKPMMWTFQQTHTVFAGRLLKLLDDLRHSYLHETLVVYLVDTIVDWISAKRQANESFGAATIETEFRPSGANSADIRAWERVWPIVLQAHSGNIPMTFGGTLIKAEWMAGNDTLMPSGPEAIESELKAGVDLYEKPGDSGHVLKTEEEDPTSHLPSPTYRVDPSRLEALSFAQIEDLRENADPEQFLELRHRILGSSGDLTNGQEDFIGAAQGYIERLAVGGNLLTDNAERSEMSKIVDSPAVRRYILSPKVDTTQVVEWLMAVKVDLPMMGPNVAMCDLARLRQFQPDLLNVKATSPSEVDHWLFKRPDYRVVERIRLKYYESERL